MERMLPRLLLAAAAAALIAPAAASAEDLCVGAPAGCAGQAFPAEELAAALFAAEHNGTADRVLLGALDEEIPPIAYASAEPLELVGAGAGSTTLRFRQAGTALDLGTPAARIRGLTLDLSGAAEVGLALNGATGEDLTISSAEAPSLQAPVTLERGGTLADSRVTRTAAQTGVLVAGGRATVVDTEIENPEAFASCRRGPS